MMEYEEAEEELELDMGDCVIEEEDPEDEDNLSRPFVYGKDTTLTTPTTTSTTTTTTASKNPFFISDRHTQHAQHAQHTQHSHEEEQIGPPVRESRAFSQQAHSMPPVEKLLSMLPRSDTFFVLVWGDAKGQKEEMMHTFFEEAKYCKVQGATWTAFGSKGASRTEIHFVQEEKAQDEFVNSYKNGKKEKEKTVDLLWYCIAHTGWKGRKFGANELNGNSSSSSSSINSIYNNYNNNGSSSNSKEVLFDTQLNVGEDAEKLKKISETYPILLINLVASGEDINRGLHLNAVKRWSKGLKNTGVIREHIQIDVEGLGRNDKFFKLAKKTLSAIRVKATIKDYKGKKGAIYEGQTVHGIPHGRGQEENSITKEIYDGEWQEDARHGYGTLYYPTNDCYEGNWRFGHQHGWGRFTWANGDSFHGQWLKGKRVGSGTITWLHSPNRKLECVWNDDKPENIGVITSGNGDRYEGGILCTSTIINVCPILHYVVQKHGEGQMVFADRSRYLGSFSHDLRDGYGVFVFADGDRYYGMWKDNMRHGPGLFMYSDGTFFEGGWSNDAKEGMGRLTFPNGDSLTGIWKNDNVVNAAYVKGSVEHCSRLSKRLISQTLADAQDAKNSLIMPANKWRTICSSLPSHIQVSAGKLSISLGDPLHDIGRPVEQFVQIFQGIYASPPSDRIEFLVPAAVDDVISFITCLHKAYLERVEWGAETDPMDGSKILLQLMKERVFNALYATLFNLYKIKNKDKDRLLASRMEALQGVTPKDLGVSFADLLVQPKLRPPESPPPQPHSPLFARVPKFQFFSSQQSPARLKPASPSPTPSPSSSPKFSSPFLTQSPHLPKQLQQQQQQQRASLQHAEGDYLLLNPAISELRKIAKEKTLRGKLNSLVETSKALISALASLDNPDIQFVGAEEKFPLFVYVLIKANISHPWAQCNFLSDFLPRQTVTQTEGGYRFTELTAALELCMGLDWNIRNENGTLISVVSLGQRLKREIQSANSAYAREYAHQQFLLSQPRSPHPQHQQQQQTLLAEFRLRHSAFQVLFFAKILRAIASRGTKQNPYKPFLLDPLQASAIIYSSKLQETLFLKVLHCMGLALTQQDKQQQQQQQRKENEKDKEKEKEEKEGKQQIEFTICYPLWVYNKFADIIGKAGNA